MIAADTSTWIAFLEGAGGEDTELLDKALNDRQVVMVPAVLTELFSDPKLPAEVAETLSELPLMEVRRGFLATRRDIARASSGKAPQGSPRRRADRTNLY